MNNKITSGLLGLSLLTVSVPALSGDPQPVVKSPYDSYIVVMDAKPVISYDGGITGYEATKPAKGKKINAKSHKVKKYKNKLKQDHDEVLASYGLQSKKGHDYGIALNGFSVRMSYEQAQTLALDKNVTKVVPDRLYQLTTDNSPRFLGLESKKGAWNSGLTGEGVVVGVIDSGIWPEHPSFADDGSYAPPPVPAVPCEFGNVAHNADDVAFACNNKLIGARQMLSTYRAFIGATPAEFDSARDDDGHGTHTASTAAGNAGVPASILGLDRGVVSGIAPRAHIIAYKGLGTQGGFGSDLAAAIDQAVADGVDVINYSVGGGCCDIGPDDISFLFAADAGVFVATSNGNSGPSPGTTGSPAMVPWLTSVGASTQDRTFQGSVASVDGWEVFGESVTDGTVDLPLIDAADAGGELCYPGTLDPVLVTGKIVLCKRGSFARVAKSLAVFDAGGAGMILYNASDSQSQVTDTHWVPSVHINNTDGLAVKSYIATTATPTARITAGVFTEQDAPHMAGFSSRGPNGLSGDLIKPDITAPGVNILAGTSPLPISSGPTGELFQAISGTSMSSPHVAGLFALIKQAHPDWSPAMAKSALMTTSYQDVMKEDGITPADAFDMGAGHVNPGSDADKKGSMFNPGLVYDAGLFEYAAFTCGSDLGIFTLGTCDFLDGLGVPSESSNLNLPSIGIDGLAGQETVYRTVTMLPTKSMKAKTYYPHIDPPPGFEVSVSPDKLKLAGGESATYAVTITNVGAPIDEWSHGSLAWSTKKPKKAKSAKSVKSSKKSKKSKKSRKNSDVVYSPIAVRGVMFAQSGDVTASGESGSASIDVGFGYTGAYSAAPHGLVADAPTTDTISQDPDQYYFPGDPDDAGVDKFDFVVTGSAFVRWELKIPGPDDIDLFVQDALGNILAASTNGGTDEAIEGVLVPDGTYTLVVHGWSVPSEPLPYSLSYWNVPLAPGGNLSIDSAPASAVAGAVESVDVSWSGLAAGMRHYGAVSHTGPGGLMDLSLIKVDSP